MGATDLARQAEVGAGRGDHPEIREWTQRRARMGPQVTLLFKTFPNPLFQPHLQPSLLLPAPQRPAPCPRTFPPPSFPVCAHWVPIQIPPIR